jgi:hypothetical protein
MTYTKHQIKRIRDLNDKYFEVLFSKRSLKFLPGCSVTLYNGPDVPIFIASGMQEPWVRIILDRDLFPDFDHNAVSIKLNLKISNLLPGLVTEEQPNFVITSAGVSPFFSYASTYPSVKSKVCYLGEDKITEDWIKMSHKLVDIRKMRRAKNLYILGDGVILRQKACKLLNNCKDSYLYEQEY